MYSIAKEYNADNVSDYQNESVRDRSNSLAIKTCHDIISEFDNETNGDLSI